MAEVSEAGVKKQWLVRTGNMEKIIEAESGDDAILKLFTSYDGEDIDEEDPPLPGTFGSAIEVVGEEYWFSTEWALRKTGRLVN